MRTPGHFTLHRGEVISPENFDFGRFDALLSQTEGIDTFCSSSCWAESCRQAFMPNAPLAVYRHRTAMAVFAFSRTADGLRMLLPLDATWTLGSSIAAINPRRDLPGLVHAIVEDQAFWDFCILAGVRTHSSLYRTLHAALWQHPIPVGQTVPAHRAVADLSDGFDAWFARRSSKFRASIRRAERKTHAHGIRFEYLPLSAIDLSLMDVFHDIESRSWKGEAATGITEQRMADFVSSFLRRTRARDQTRITLAYLGDQPVGFILGAVFQSGYRGAQMSFDNSFRGLGLGNMLQIHMIRSLLQEHVQTYDLGSSMPYKLRWADIEDTTSSFFVGMLHRLR